MISMGARSSNEVLRDGASVSEIYGCSIVKWSAKRWGSRQWNLWMLDRQMRCQDLTTRQGTRIVPEASTRVTWPWWHTTWHCLQSSHCWGKTLDQGPFSVLSKLRLCSANYRAGYFSNLSCDWQSIVWAYSEQETENGPRFWTPQRHLTSGPDGHSLSGSFWSVHCQCLRDNWPLNINGTRTALYRFFLENQCIWKCCAMKLYLLKP